MSFIADALEDDLALASLPMLCEGSGLCGGCGHGVVHERDESCGSGCERVNGKTGVCVPVPWLVVWREREEVS